MIELDLLGVGADGQTLVFTDAQGERYSAPITDELRGAVRRDRPALEAVPAPGSTPLRPRDIQALLRSGASAQDIARHHGMEVSQILRYEGPVRAEKDFALRRALDAKVGPDADAPLMGELVVDRLAARGVDPTSLAWSARREGTGPWQISLTFVQGASEHAATWTLNSRGSVEALDQEAKWLTETVAQTPSASVFTPLPTPVEVVEPGGAVDDAKAREVLLDQLNQARGKRQVIDLDLGDEDDDAPEELFGTGTGTGEVPASQSSISARIYSLAHARTKEVQRSGTIPVIDEGGATADTPSPASSLVDSAVEDSEGRAVPADTNGDDTLPGLDSLGTTPVQESTKKKSRRRSVPSWDEIVFGSKN